MQSILKQPVVPRVATTLRLYTIRMRLVVDREPTVRNVSDSHTEIRSTMLPVTRLDVRLNSPSEIPWASVAQPPILAPIHSFIETYNLHGGGHISPPPP